MRTEGLNCVVLATWKRGVSLTNVGSRSQKNCGCHRRARAARSGLVSATKCFAKNETKFVRFVFRFVINIGPRLLVSFLFSFRLDDIVYVQNSMEAVNSIAFMNQTPCIFNNWDF